MSFSAFCAYAFLSGWGLWWCVKQDQPLLVYGFALMVMTGYLYLAGG